MIGMSEEEVVWAMRQEDLTDAENKAMTEPIQAVEVPTPKPKLPRRYVMVDNVPLRTKQRYCFARVYESLLEAKRDVDAEESIYPISASDEPAKPVVCAIPTAEEMLRICLAEPTTERGVKAIHALVTSLVVEAKHRTGCDCASCTCDADYTPPFDPIKAIVEILDAIIPGECLRVRRDLSALKRSLETGQ